MRRRGNSEVLYAVKILLLFSPPFMDFNHIATAMQTAISYLRIYTARINNDSIWKIVSYHSKHGARSTGRSRHTVINPSLGWVFCNSTFSQLNSKPAQKFVGTLQT